jgi:hypothetical protein
VAKDHPEIALLRCRTFAVAHRFTDKEVLEPAFAERVGEVAEVMRPLVHWWVTCMVACAGADVHSLNDMMTIPPDDEDEDDGEDGEEAGEDMDER